MPTHKIVPVEPTEEMITRACDAGPKDERGRDDIAPDDFRKMYCAAVAASPPSDMVIVSREAACLAGEALSRSANNWHIDSEEYSELLGAALEIEAAIDECDRLSLAIGGE